MIKNAWLGRWVGRIRLRLVVLCAGFLFLPLARAAAESPVEHRFSFGGGIFTPIDAAHRGVFGSGPELSLEYAASLSRPNTWLVLETGWMRASGRILPSDPSFDVDEESYTVIPVGLGLRAGGAGEHPVQVSVGVMGHWLYSRLTGPFGSEQSQWGFGIAAEIRPEIRLTERWSLWFRERIRATSEFTYRDVGNETLVYKGAIFQAGIVTRIR